MTTSQNDSTISQSNLHKSIIHFLNKVPAERHTLITTAFKLLDLALGKKPEPKENDITAENLRGLLQAELFDKACISAYLLGLGDGEKKAKEEFETPKEYFSEAVQVSTFHTDDPVDADNHGKATSLIFSVDGTAIYVPFPHTYNEEELEVPRIYFDGEEAIELNKFLKILDHFEEIYNDPRFKAALRELNK